jgi:peptidoglycan/LPS O-acetylase OafA/YrhL
VPEAFNRDYFYGLDGLRAISILIVIIGHLNFRWGINWVDHIFDGGHLGVYIFFVISGFLITTLLIKEQVNTGTISLKQFYLRRFFRIFPVAYLYLAVVIVLSYFYHLQVSLYAIVGAALYFRNFSFAGGGSWYVNHYWSLAVEEQFYLIFPGIVKWNLKKYSLLIIVLIPIIVLFRFFSMKYIFIGYQSIISDFLDKGLEGILFGSLFSILVFQKMVNWSFFVRWQVYINIGLVIIIVCVHNNFLNTVLFHLIPSFLSNSLLYISIGLLIVNNLTPSQSVFFKILNSSVLRWIGMLSYSIYIWQQLFTANEKLVPGASSLPWYSFPLNIILLSVISILSYKFYEQPIRLFYKRIAIDKNKEL